MLIRAISRLILRVSRGLVHILGGLAAGLVITTLLLAWLLSRGPISLGFISPHVDAYFENSFPHVQIDYDDAQLSWAGWNQVVGIALINLQINASEDTFVARIPKATMVLSTKGLLEGVIAPSSLDLYGPTLNLVQAVDGSMNMAFAGIGAIMSGRLEPFLSRASQEPDPALPLSFLKKIEIRNADVIVTDSATTKTWVTPDVDIVLRKSPGRIDAETSFLVNMEDDIADVSFVVGYDNESRRIDAGISFNRIMPSALAGLAPETAFLQYLEIPVQGTLTLAASADGVLESIGFNLVGDAGEIHLPAPLDGTLRARSVVFNGHYDASTGRIDIDELRAQMEQGQHVMLPAPVSHLFPISNFDFKGSYDGLKNHLEINNFDLDFDGLKASIKGSVGHVTELVKASLVLEIPELSFADVSRLWPSTMGSDSHAWVMSHVSAGTIHDLNVEFEGEMNKQGSFIPSRVDGEFEVHDASVLYVEGMPPVSEIMATAVFQKNKLEFDVSKSRSHDLNIHLGKISLYDLDTDIEKANIKLQVNGPFQKVMELIDRDPMRYASENGIDPEKVAGTSQVELAFQFPLKKTLGREDVIFSAEAQMQDVEVPGGLFNLDIHQGNLNVSMDNAGMDIHGELVLNEFPTIISWRQNFKKDSEFLNRYELSVELKDIKGFDDLGIDVHPFPSDMIAGDIPLKLKVTQNHVGPMRLEAEASLIDLSFSVPAINWYKPTSVPGTIQVVFNIKNETIIDIPEFMLKANDLEIAGSAHYAKAGKQLDKIELSRVRYGRTDLKGILVPGAKGVWDADFSGPSLDLSTVWDDIIYGDLFDAGESVLENISVSTQFDKVWLSEDRFFDNMTGAFVRANEQWRTVYIDAEVEGGAPLSIKLAPSEQKNRRILTAWSTDAGAVLRAFDFYDTMIGGDLSLTGHFDDDLEKSPLFGFFDVDDYRIIEAPALAKVISIMSLTGIADALAGDGLGFTNLHIPFRYGEGILELREAKATGASLGFTAAGKLYTQANAIDVSGTMIPVYAVNSLLGKIPILGNIFTGGEEGGGIFAADYFMTGAIDDPEITVNPLSMLTPGFLRNIFDVFESDAPPEGVEVEPDSP